MAGLLFHATSGEVTAVSTAKTLLQIQAPANQRVLVRGIRVFGKDATNVNNTPAKVRITRSTASAGTASGSAVKYTLDPTDPETIQSTCSLLSTEPVSPTDTGITYELPPQTGISEFFPLGAEWKIPKAQYLNVEVTPGSGTSTFTATLLCEE